MDGATATMLAIINDRFDMAATLLDLGPDPNDGALFHAVEMRDATTDWRAKDGSRLRSNHDNKLTALDLTKLLLEKGADPNKPFIKEAAQPAPAQTPAGQPADGEKKFSFYDLAPGAGDKPADKPAVQPAKPDAKPADAKPADAKPAAAADDKTKYLLQAGAFKSQADAEAMKAKLALLGFNAAVSSADKDGAPVYRVRIGPIDKLDEANRTRQTLAQSGVDASVMTLK